MKKIFLRIMIILCLVFETVLTQKVDAKEFMTGLSYDNIKFTIDQYVDEHKNNLAGMSMAIYDSEGVIYEGNYGYKDIENGLLVDENTVFEWGSNSKLLIWVSVMQLYERNLIDLNRDIREYLPENFLKLSYNKKITMIDLMNHQAGFQDTYLGMQVPKKEKIESLEIALKKYQPKQVYEPSTLSAYSNYGASLAAFVVERISGISFTEYVHKNIFEPLGMRHTSISADLSDNEWVKEKTKEIKNYDTNRKLLKAQEYYFNFYPCGAATGTISDMVLFAMAITPSKSSSPLFVNENTLNILLTPTKYYGDTNIPSIYHGFITTNYETLLVGHNGATLGQSASLFFDVNSGIGMVVMANEKYETIFNQKMYEIIFGSPKDSEFAKLNLPRPKGIIAMARAIKEGPLSISSMFGFTNLPTETTNLIWAPVNKDIITFGAVDGILNSKIFIIKLVLLILLLISIMRSIFVVITFIPNVLKHKNFTELERLNYYSGAAIICFIINLLSLIANILNDLYIEFWLYKFQITIFLSIAITLSILSIFSIKKYINDKQLRGKEKRKYISMSFSNIVVILNIIVFDMYQFWEI